MNVATTASRQLFSRAGDEVFSGWDHILSHLRTVQDNTVEVPLNHLSAVADRDSVYAQFSADGGDTYATRMNDWSFNQMTKFTEVRGVYSALNALSPQTSASALNELLVRNGAQDRDRVALVHLSPKPTDEDTMPHDPVSRAFYSTSYNRVGDLEVFKHFHHLSEQFGYEPAGRFAGKRGGLAPVKPEASGLYRGDRSSFGFVANELGRIDIDNSSLYHAVMWGNSEVGKETLWFQDVLYNYICGNHMIYSPKRMRMTKHRHTGAVRSVLMEATRMFESVDGEREDRRLKTQEMFSKASTTIFAQTRKLVEKKLASSLTKRDAMLSANYLEHPFAYPKNPISVWGVAQAITLASQEKVYVDERRAMDKVAGNMLAQL